MPDPVFSMTLTEPGCTDPRLEAKTVGSSHLVQLTIYEGFVDATIYLDPTQLQTLAQMFSQEAA